MSGNYSIIKEVTVLTDEYDSDECMGGLITIDIPAGTGSLHSVDLISTANDYPSDLRIDIFTSSLGESSRYEDDYTYNLDNSDVHKLLYSFTEFTEINQNTTFRFYTQQSSNVPTQAPFALTDSVIYAGIVATDYFTFNSETIKLKFNFCGNKMTNNYSIIKDVPVSLTAYATNDNIGGLITVDMPKTTGKIHSIDIINYDNLTGFCATIFDANPTSSTFTDNAAYTIHDSDIDKLIATFTTNTALEPRYARNYSLMAANVPLPMPFGLTSSNLYVILYNGSGADRTFTQDIKIKLNFVD